MTTTFLLPVRFSCDSPGCNNIATGEVEVTVNMKSTAKVEQPYPDYPEGWMNGFCPACESKKAAALATALETRRAKYNHDTAEYVRTQLAVQAERNRLAAEAVKRTAQVPALAGIMDDWGPERVPYPFGCSGAAQSWCARPDCIEAKSCQLAATNGREKP